MARRGSATQTENETNTHIPPSSVQPKQTRESGKNQPPIADNQKGSQGHGAVETEVVQSTPPTDSLVDLFDQTGHDQDQDHGDLDPGDELTPG